MHILGKILLWLAVIGSVAAMYLTAKDLDLRKAWMIKVQKLEDEYAKNQELLEQKTKALHEVRTELARVMLDWDRYWGEVPECSLQPPNQAQIGVGQTRGIQEKQVVFVFPPNGDGTFSFLGDFKVTTAREDKAALEANWRFRPGELNAKPVGNWRIRASIPAHFQSRFHELEVQLVVADELISSYKAELARETDLIKVAEEHLELRLGEINGFPALEGKVLPPEVIKGLLTVLVDEEEARNVALMGVDRLRRQLKVANERFESIRARNDQLVRSLPQPASKNQPGPKKETASVTKR